MSYERIIGRIDAVNGTNPGPASGISYTIGVNWQGTNVPFENQRPSEERWPDVIGGQPAHVRALPIGQMVPGDFDEAARVVYWWFSEWPDAGTCDQIGGSPNLLQIDPVTKRPLPPPPPPPPSQSTASQASAPDSGGGPDAGGGG